MLLYLLVGGIMIALASKKAKWLVFSLSFLALISFHRCSKLWFQSIQKEIIIYYTPGYTCIDFISGQNVLTLSNLPKNHFFHQAILSHRSALGVNKVDSLTTHLNKTPQYQSLESGLVINFFDTKIGIVYNNSEKFGTMGKSFDYLVLVKEKEINFAHLIPDGEIKQVILSSANSYKDNQEFTKLCDKYQVSSYDIRSQGAKRIIL